jgi:HD-GYP domain-containing protein (c-di-GMP phosphodiesterase class II)
MLKPVSTRQLRIGMHVHEVCGSWLDHPFWRGAFKIENARQLQQLMAVQRVVIDTDKGLDVEASPAPLAAPEGDAGCSVEIWDDIEVGAVDDSSGHAPASGDSLRLLDVPPPTAPPQRSGFHAELARAKAIVGAARGAMQAMFNDARMGQAVDTEHCLPLVQDITDSVGRNPGALVSLARLKTSDDYTYMHSVAVCALMVSLSKQLGLNAADTREAGLAGLVHDIGKALMPKEVLLKPGALTPAEFAIMKGHPEAGHRMLLDGQGVGPVPLDVALHHHEKVNGKGYPHGLKGDEISLFARMGAVCDVYDAITSNRPYKAGWDPAESLQKMAAWARDGHFDEAIFQAFVKSIGIYPTGSLVRLKSERLAVVVDQGGGSLLKPLVKVFHCARQNTPLPTLMLDLADPAANDAIVAREKAADWGLQRTDEVWMLA